MAESYNLKAILSAVDNLSPVLKSVQGIAKNTRKYLGDVGSSINSLAGKVGIPLGLVSGLAAGLGALAIKRYVTDFAAFSESVMKSGYAMGMSNTEAQRMKYVAEQAGLQVESLQLSMGKLNKNLGAAGSGKNKDLEQLLKTLGVPLRGVNGQIRNAADMLPELAQAFVKNQDPVKQAAIGNALFGKSYQDMLPFLNEGSEGIANSLARFKQLGDVVSDQDLKGAKAFGDQMQDLGFIGQSFQRMIAKELVPVLGPLIEKLIQWTAANKDLIAGEISKAVKGLVAAIQGVDWAAFIKGVKDTVAWIGKMIDKVGGAKNALIGLIALMNVQSIVAIGALIGTLGRLSLALGGVIARMALLGGGVAMSAIKGIQSLALAVRILGLSAVASWAMVLGPLLFIGAVLAGAAYLIYKNWGGIKAFFGGVWAGFIAALGPVAAAFEPVTSAVKSVIGWIGSLFGATSKGKEDFASWANAGRLAGEIVGTVFRLMLAPIFAVVDAIALVVAAVKFLGGGGFKFDSSLAGLFDGAGSPAADIARSPSQPSAPGGLGSGSFNINAPATASLTGKVEVDFKNAPPGMQVTQAKATGGRVAMNTNVGHRTVGTEGAW